MIKWIIVLGIIAFAVGVLLNVFFTYIPVARIEETIEKAAADVEKVADAVDETVEKVDMLIDEVAPGILKILPKLEEILDKFCQLDPSLC